MSDARQGPVFGVLFLLVTTSWGTLTAQASEELAGSLDQLGPGVHWLVGLDRGAPLPPPGASFAGFPVVAAFDRLHAIRVSAAHDADPDAVSAALEANGPLTYAAPEPHVFAATHVQEPKLGDQTHHGLLKSPTAWHLTTGSADIRLAVLDSGVDIAHEEFSGRIAAARDFLDDDATVEDDCQHGTPVAGLAAAAVTNGKGGAGMATVSLIVARVLAPEGTDCLGPLGDAAEALLWAAESGARIVLMSFGSNTDHPALREAVRAVAAKGILLVAAAGNTNGGAVQYPAAYPEVVAVGSVRNDKALSTFSPRGPVDLVAPGENLFTTLPGNAYGRVTGTSAAAPLVAGTAGLMMSVYPDITVAQVRSFLNDSAERLRGPDYDEATGYGLLNALGATNKARDLGNTAPWLDANGFNQRIKAGRSFTFTPNAWDRNGDMFVFNATGLPPGSRFDPATGRIDWTPALGHVGPHRYTITVSDGQAEASRTGLLEVYQNPPPIAALSGPTRVDARTAATFDASASSDGDHTPITFAWDPDITDGEDFVPGENKRALSWTTPGRYTVGVRITDEDGDRAVATLPVNVDDILVGYAFFAREYDVDDNIRGHVSIDWIGGDDRTRISVQVQRFVILAGAAAVALDNGQPPVTRAVEPDGIALIDLEPDMPSTAGNPGRNLVGLHELVITATLKGSLNGDTETFVQKVRYDVVS